MNTMRIPIALLSVALALTGCSGYYTSAYIGTPPPPPLFGPVGVAPGPGFVWLDGFYDLRGGRWRWVNGRWARPPRPGAIWERPRWDGDGRGYRFHRGRWR